MRKRFAGIDIGSRSIELVVVDDLGKIYRRCGQKPLYAAFPGGNIGQKRSGTRRSPTGRGSGGSASGQGNPVKIQWKVRK